MSFCLAWVDVLENLYFKVLWPQSNQQKVMGMLEHSRVCESQISFLRVSPLKMNSLFIFQS